MSMTFLTERRTAVKTLVATFAAAMGGVELSTGAARAATNTDPDRLTVPQLAAELTNHLIPGVVLTPGAVGTLPELQQAGFAYAR
jgi:hypothetical protein